MKLWAIARNTFREFIRDRILYNIMAFAIFLIVAADLVFTLAFYVLG